MKTHIDQVCRFDMHPAFEEYECPFIKTNDIPKSCKELDCPMYDEIVVVDDISEETPQ